MTYISPRHRAAERVLNLRTELADNGWHPLPISGKGCFLRGWPAYCDAPPTEADLEEWSIVRRRDSGTGIACGRVIAVDVDVLDEPTARALEALTHERLGYTPLRRVGRAPKALLVYRAAGAVRKAATQHYTMPGGADAMVEVLAHGQQFAAYGNHPKTKKPYEWTIESPLAVCPDELPEVTQDQITDLLAAAADLIRSRGGAPKETQRVARAAPSAAVRAERDASPFGALCAAALARLSEWIPSLDRTAKPSGPNHYRLTAAWKLAERPDASRYSVSAAPSGIRDFGGGGGGMTPVGLVMRLRECGPKDAADWLADTLGLPRLADTESTAPRTQRKAVRTTNLPPAYPPIRTSRDAGLAAMRIAIETVCDAAADRTRLAAAEATARQAHLEDAAPEIERIIRQNRGTDLDVRQYHLTGEAPTWIGSALAPIKAAASRAARRAVYAETAQPPAATKVLVAAPAGAGKTTMLESMGGRFAAIVEAGGTVWLTEPTSEKAEELTEALQAAGVPAVMVRGRAALDLDAADGSRMCGRHDVADEVARRGVSVAEAICSVCPLRDSCGYLRQRTKAPGIYVLASQYLFVPGAPVPRPSLLVVDESVLSMVTGRVAILLDRVRLTACTGLVPDAELAAAGDVLDTLRGVLEAGGPILAGLRRTWQDDAVDVLRSTLRTARAIDQRQRARLADLDDTDLIPVLERHDTETVTPLVRLLKALITEVLTGRDEATSVMVDPDYRVMVDGTSTTASAVVVDYQRRLSAGQSADTILLDASGDVVLARMVFGPEVQDSGCRIERRAHVTQVTSRTFSRSSLLVPVAGQNSRTKAGATHLAGQVRDFVAGVAAKHGPTLVVSYKTTTNEGQAARWRPVVDEAPDLDVRHFGALRGLNAYGGHACAVIIGREENLAAAEQQARALHAADVTPIETIDAEAFAAGYYRASYRLRTPDGAPPAIVEVVQHPDPRVQRLLVQAREREIEQAIDRLRLIHTTEPKHVYILGCVPVDLTVNRVWRWEQAMTGGDAAERMMEAGGIVVCGRRAAVAAYPGLFAGVAKLTEGVTVESGFAANIDSISRKAAFLVRIDGQRGSPTTVVVDIHRHADPRAAVEALLGPLASMEAHPDHPAIQDAPAATAPPPAHQPEPWDHPPALHWWQRRHAEALHAMADDARQAGRLGRVLVLTGSAMLAEAKPPDGAPYYQPAMAAE